MKKLDELDIKNKKVIIFDMDGTLIDSIGVWNSTDRKIIYEHGNQLIKEEIIQKDRDTFLMTHQNTDIYLEYCKYLIDKYNLDIKDINELIKIRWDNAGKILENDITFKPHVSNLIYKLKELGFKIVLATMTTPNQLNIYSNKNKKMYEEMQIYDVFDYIVTKDDVKNKKPNPEIYNLIKEKLNVSSEECIVFEDSYTGVLASNNANIEVINIYDKYADADREKIDLITDYKINDYMEFIEYIDKIYSKEKKYIKH